MDELTRMKHQIEQWAYDELRSAAVADFLTEQQQFIAQHGKRPEDLSGSELRSLYPNFLVQQREVKNTNEGFRRRFYEGSIF